jgi:DNA-binding HxlR family transcriptional regulator
MSSSVLYERLNELDQAGLICQNDSSQYELTVLGRELGDAIDPLERWSKRWAQAR